MVATPPKPIADLTARARELGARNPTYFDVDRATHDAWGVSGHPTILVVDGAGTVVREVDWLAMIGDVGEGESQDAWRLHLEDALASELDALLR